MPSGNCIEYSKAPGNIEAPDLPLLVICVVTVKLVLFFTLFSLFLPLIYKCDPERIPTL